MNSDALKIRYASKELNKRIVYFASHIFIATHTLTWPSKQVLVALYVIKIKELDCRYFGTRWQQGLIEQCKAQKGYFHSQQFHGRHS